MLKIFKRFYRFLLVYRSAFFVFASVLVLTAVIGNLSPYFYKLLVDTLPGRNYQQILRVLFLLVGTRVATNLLSALGHFLGDRVLIPAARDARVKIFRQVQDLDFAFHVNKSTGSLISAFKRGDGAFFNLFHNLHHEIGTALISLLVLLFFFSQVSLTIVWLALAIFVGNAFLSWRLIKLNIKKRRIFNQNEDRISGIVTDNLINYETVKFFGQEEKETKRLKARFQDWSQALWHYVNTFRVMDISVGMVSNLGAFFIYWLVVKKLVAGEIGVGDFVMVASFMTSFYFQFFRLLYHARAIATHFSDLERYFAILDQKVIVQDPVKPVRVAKIKGKIEFDNVSFHYPDSGKKVLRNISLRIKPGESIAFVGRSGVGKTTIVRLLMRFYDVNQGAVKLDGIDVRRFNKSRLRRFLGIVPQEPILFNNTIGFNIGYGKKASRRAIIKAAKLANLHDFIWSLPQKYETQVGERGIKLSGGQKQRLAIARMLLTDPKIIIFDEATSNLDSESEKLIQDALWKIAHQRTVLIIAHRFATVRRADKIVVMDKGRIVEVGSHQDLVENKKGLYHYLWLLQAKGGQEKDQDLLK